MLGLCRSIGCCNTPLPKQDFCAECQSISASPLEPVPRSIDSDTRTAVEQTMAERYPKYYKSVGDMTEVDVYAVHHLFDIQDPSGAIQHASKKLLLSGVRTGGKSKLKDIREARDTLTRWLQLNDDTQ